jgi:23S rRNA pseudouridine1911/1915/1917 synthase
MTLIPLYNAGGVLAVSKPAGLPTQAPAGIASVESHLREQLFGPAFAAALAAGSRRHPGGFLGVPHRLDRAVSGVLLMATTPRAARQLSRQFQRRQIDKTYLALVTACPSLELHEGKQFTWQDWLVKVPGEPRAECVSAVTADAQAAETSGCVLAVSGEQVLLELHPQTGRMHQLRVQAAARGMPMVGDWLYGGEGPQEPDRSSPIGLHARAIRFRCPETDRPVQVTAPLPAGSLWEPWAR